MLGAEERPHLPRLSPRRLRDLSDVTFITAAELRDECRRVARGNWAAVEKALHLLAAFVAEQIGLLFEFDPPQRAFPSQAHRRVL